MPNANVMEFVWWFEHAERGDFGRKNAETKPWPAMVVETDGRGCLSLLLFGTSSAVRFISGARHIDDQLLKDNPDIARHSGGWMLSDPGESFLHALKHSSVRDMIKAIVREELTAVAERAKTPHRIAETADITDEDRAEVVRLSEAGHRPSEIAALTGKGWHYQTVNKILREEKEAVSV